MTHGHLQATVETAPAWGVLLGFLVLIALFYGGALPIPVGYRKGKIEWIKWCGTGMHTHTVYWTDNGFQTLHPKERDSA